jgi:hypothetical protein
MQSVPPFRAANSLDASLFVGLAQRNQKINGTFIGIYPQIAIRVNQIRLTTCDVTHNVIGYFYFFVL